MPSVSIFLPNAGCKNRCAFCDQGLTTGEKMPSPGDIRGLAEKALELNKEKASGLELSFFGGSFTALPPDVMEGMLSASAPFVRNAAGKNTGDNKELFCGVRVSTRPDCIDETVLEMLKFYGVTAIELGAQSMDDGVLLKNMRGHTSAHTASAAAMIKEKGIELGIHMMTGLYGGGEEESFATAGSIASLSPDLVRIHPTLVLKGTALESLYTAGEYIPISLDESAELCAKLMDFFEEKGITVARVGLHFTQSLQDGVVAGPWHPAFGEICAGMRFLIRARKGLFENNVPKGNITLRVNPKDLSKMTGQKKSNLTRLKESGHDAAVATDETLAKNSIIIIKEGMEPVCC